ncbi:hypothetical protein ACJIZ3_018345 [Penstemon smallii]|uniref:NET domain-containing protein n=1 Tax=Penstemon smallii TaxID=265156 RepID=A0ABD3SZA4_9LAMI
MSQKSEDLPASGDKNKGPDFFGYYTSEVAELLSQDGGLRLSSDQTSNDFGGEKGKLENNFRTKEKNNGSNGSASLYSNGIGALLSECKKERLKSLLRQSVFTLTEEVDEVIDPVLSLCRILSCLRYKESLLNLDSTACKADHTQNAHKKLKVSPPSSVLHTTSGGGEIDDDLRFLLENDSTAVEELMKKHSSEFLAALQHMEQKLEELLNIVMTSCRPMTLTEKQHLRKAIQNLPRENLDHVVEIIGHNKPTDKYSSDEVHVDLEQEVINGLFVIAISSFLLCFVSWLFVIANGLDVNIRIR